MNLLLDTHALLWWLDDDAQLAAEAADAIGDGANLVVVSAASAWEIGIKSAAGRLRAPDDLGDVIRTSHLVALAITVDHAVAAGALPRHHGDPFDRMLVAQAQLDGLTLVTRDARIARYDVPVLAA